jgi:hypothetical protein
MKRFYLAFAAAVVVIAVIGLVIALVSDEPPATTTAKAPAAAEPGKPRRAPVPAPPAPTAGSSAPTGSQIVHDHRAPAPAATEPSPSETPPPERPPPGERPAGSQTTQVLSQRLPAALQECAANLQPTQHGVRSRIEGEIRIAIKDHQATITSAAFQLRDVIDAVQDEIKQCLVRHAVGVTAPADDEADIDSRAISVSLRWP